MAAAGLSAFLGLSVAALISVWLTMSGRPVSPPAILVAAGITTLCSYRPFKSLVFSLHWLGLVRDPPRKNNLLVLDFKKKKDRGTG